MTTGTSVWQVEIASFGYGGGYKDKGGIESHGYMNLSGTLHRFTELKISIEDKPHYEVRVEIFFYEHPDKYDGYEDTEGRDYIGFISMNKESRDGFIHITLPLKMFQNLSLWRDRHFILETFHDFIEQPSDQQKQDGVVAYVKSISFIDDRK